MRSWTGRPDELGSFRHSRADSKRLTGSAGRIRSRVRTCFHAFNLRRGRQWMGFEPERPGCGCGINIGISPPCGFVTATMDFTMVAATEWDSEFVAHLAAKRPILGKAQMMRIG